MGRLMLQPKFTPGSCETGWAASSRSWRPLKNVVIEPLTCDAVQCLVRLSFRGFRGHQLRSMPPTCPPVSSVHFGLTAPLKWNHGRWVLLSAGQCSNAASRSVLWLRHSWWRAPQRAAASVEERGKLVTSKNSCCWEKRAETETQPHSSGPAFHNKGAHIATWRSCSVQLDLLC